ncbi:hypothetical protein SG34_009930 [Thalassomonas viridans]|uniref:Uncharacterized protein n=1 Tax=Thalassomonas viridans TaxID=137584 RepID=A0AAE9Z707_9GAMM|nr:hypothetical protein [Thalassomonas viridans]WDE07175.1 hypothetical protein SG34_009930 [Thalassomonas viridans]
MTSKVKAFLAAAFISLLNVSMPVQAETISCTFDDGSGHFEAVTDDYEQGSRLIELCIGLGGTPSFR